MSPPRDCRLYQEQPPRQCRICCKAIPKGPDFEPRTLNLELWPLDFGPWTLDFVLPSLSPVSKYVVERPTAPASRSIFHRQALSSAPPRTSLLPRRSSSRAAIFP